MQTLLGNLNHVGQMCPFLLNFRFNLNKSLANCSVTEELVLPDATLHELKIWKKFLLKDQEWCPIAHPVHHHPSARKRFSRTQQALEKKEFGLETLDVEW
jgi:hypothetical protein